MKPLRIVILVSEDRSDIYFANRLAERFPVAGIFVETQYGNTPTSLAARLKKGLGYAVSPGRLAARFAERKILRDYGQLAHDAWLSTCGRTETLEAIPENCRIVRTRGVRDINDPLYVRQIASLRPDLIAVCGCSILGPEILAIPPLGVLNLHGGLSQHYRGVWTTLWAVHNEEPEYVGATVHYVSSGIDDGDIIFQGRPVICPGDNPETLYAKVVRLGVRMMNRAIADVRDGRVVRHPLERKGTLYFNRQVTPAVLKSALAKIDRGLIDHYLAEKAQRDEPVIQTMYGHFQSDPHLGRPLSTVSSVEWAAARKGTRPCVSG
ncbi:formyl transferase [Geothermobacter hydrogeniphilus]|uniref:phosphoribosylglycinamide formyltransferase 1 n=1 Tax=Geothermobacter hydrogeniphilus TaxID=1969733 RepID=A0A1X0YE19_9BACT|nr:formyl transferase [Geothermobacter hydrogeniphilus]ORJ63386.1 hypothetical protein B5V00_00540 [Geothermobacter hydrogeniphilus]